jgi:ATP-dependent Clp protease ATP-binding subunit ClpB
MVRIDMSEYQEKHTVARLVGAPPGYVGYEEGGQLTEAVRRRPYAVVLLDEIEKAHPDVFNVLLQILDDGRLTDGQGRTVDFTNAIVIMTSNVGAYHLMGVTDEHIDATIRDRVMEELRATFRPEFLNRVDDVVLFSPLSRSQIAEIVELAVAGLRSRLAERGVELVLTPAATAALAEEGYDPAYGARPLRRVVQRRLQDELARRLLAGDVAPGTTVTVDADDEGRIELGAGAPVAAGMSI